MKLYYPKSHYDKSARGALFPLLKAFIKNKNFTDEQRVGMYGVTEKDFTFVDSLEEAELGILTMTWNYYTRSNQLDKAISFVKDCERRGLKVLSWNAGDHGVRVPKLDNLIVLRESGYKSKFGANEFTLPSFIGDPLKKYYDRSEPFILPYQKEPVVGFCGQAHYSVRTALTQLAQIAKRNIQYHFRLRPEEPEVLLSTIHFRAKILKGLQDHPGVKTNFILREKYRAGVSEYKDKHKHQTTLEFYNNMKTSPYIVCMRGGGNFSVRFYEALAMGRIPVFINTDSSLPFDDRIDWKKHVVWVDRKDWKRAGKKVADFHSRLSDAKFESLQVENRKLWEEKLRYGVFFKNFNSLI